MPMKFAKLIGSLALWLVMAQTTQADTTDRLCPNLIEEQRCTSIYFEQGLPQEYYQAILRSVSNQVVEDFIFYVTESHGPFNFGKSPSIDYSADFFSAALDTNKHGTIVFVVISSPTSARPFGITAIMRDGEQSRINISFGYSDYAVLEAGDDLFFIYKDRFSGAIQSTKIR